MSKRAIVAITLLASLGGCSIFGGGNTTKVAHQDTDMSSYFDERVAAGRQFLVAGLPARAVVAFRQASYNADHAAEAYNGMGVAYSMQGRPDVAQTMFQKAIAANPYDKRYSRNLARLEKRLESEAMLAENDVSEDTLAQGEVPQVQTGPDGELPPVVKQDSFVFPRTITSSGGLERRVPKETHISAVSHSASVFSANRDGMSIGPSASDQGAKQTEQRATKNPSVTVFKPNKTYPVRLAITGNTRKISAPTQAPDQSKKRATAQAKTGHDRAPTGAYPVRVALGSPDTDGRN